VIDLSGGSSINIANAWSGCTSLTTFPVLDYSNVLYAFNTWINCALSVQSIENILVALDTAGKSNVNTSVSGGTSAAKTTWSAAANTAYENLISKGWTVAHNP
jgi:CO dehydrogenase/acetyl-CoA synthase gamma subunit (corrinoid Fe-S protein)